MTQRRPGEPFTFALVSDAHIGADGSYLNQGDWCTLAAAAAQVGAAAPDFMVNLGDMLDFHQLGFGQVPSDGVLTGIAYRNYRALLGATLGHAAHYAVIGNWEGENGYDAAEVIAQSRAQRMRYVPGPTPSTYPEAGSPSEDYYAFAWGDALLIVLNVMTYTTTRHLLDYDPGLPDDWTLGEAQLAWFADTLARATARWKLVFIHHPVGGAAGDASDSAYGRGGGQAAYVGEQATVHGLMLQYGVQIFFYGHDHVFTDMQVDGIHYTEPGSAGAIWMFGASQTGYRQAWLRSGWSQVTVGPGAVEVRFRALDGTVFYAYTLE
jgi:3',5'-cyclic AMP phosphodiesterase CpdA